MPFAGCGSRSYAGPDCCGPAAFDCCYHAVNLGAEQTISFRMVPTNRFWQLGASAVLFVLFALSCGGGDGASDEASLSNPVNQNICDCTPSETASEDFRHAAKHVRLPGGSGTQVSVTDILNWSQGAQPSNNAARSGRELAVFFIPHAYLQFAQIETGDCDLHVEISDAPDKSAPRMIVETPIDGEYCDSRNALKSALAAHGFTLSTISGEADPPIPVSVRGLAFRDYEHVRGTAQVATTWEIHPAVVKVLP